MLRITLAAVIVTAVMLRRSRVRSGPREVAVLPVLADEMARTRPVRHQRSFIPNGQGDLAAPGTVSAD